MKEKEINVKVTYTEGYEKRFTEACIKQISKREMAERNDCEEEKTA